MSIHRLVLVTAVAVVFVPATGRAEDWPQFRGPGGTGVITGKILPPDHLDNERQRGLEGTRSLGTAGRVRSSPAGRSSSPVASADEKVVAPKTGYYAPTNTKTLTGEHRWTLFCLDAATGKVLWERVAHKGEPQHPIHVKASYAPETPVTDGERVYAYFGNVGLFCYDMTGKQLWSKSWDVVPTQLDWGTGASPVLHRDRLYIVNDNEKKSFLVALDKLTGKEVWKIDRDEKSNWATPFIWESGKRTEIVTCGKNKVRSYDLDGKLLWEFGGMSSICVPSPVAAHGMLFISSGYEFGRPRPVFAVRPGAAGDISLKKGETSNEFIAWYKEPAGAYHPTPLVLGDHLYVLYSTGFISCFEAKTGKPVYERERLGGSFTASPWAYDGKIFCLARGRDDLRREGRRGVRTTRQERRSARWHSRHRRSPTAGYSSARSPACTAFKSRRPRTPRSRDLHQSTASRAFQSLPGVFTRNSLRANHSADSTAVTSPNPRQRQYALAGDGSFSRSAMPHASWHRRSCSAGQFEPSQEQRADVVHHRQRAADEIEVGQHALDRHDVGDAGHQRPPREQPQEPEQRAVPDLRQRHHARSRRPARGSTSLQNSGVPA